MQTELERQVAELVGNRYWREEDARLALRAWAESGVSLTVFARRTKIHPRRLRRWRRQLLAGKAAMTSSAVVPAPTLMPVEIARASAACSPAPAFVPVVVRSALAGGGPAPAVVVRGNARVEVHELSAASAAWAAAVLRSLEEGEP